MKKLIIAMSLGLVSSVSMAAVTQLCSGTAGNGTAAPAATDGTLFVRTAFTPKCSANTQVYFDQTATAAAAGAVSTKGNQVFSGHTNGGAVAGVACAAAACTASEASTATGTALTAAGGSS